MDVLAPDLYWINGRCYRMPILDTTFSGSDISNFRDRDLEENTDNILQSEEDNVDRPEIKALSNGRYQMVFPVARSFMPFIIGSKGATIKRISKDTSCTIITPKYTEQQNIKITGPNINSVNLAWKSISIIIKSSRNKIPVTHFLCIHINSSEIRENFIKFKENVLSVCNDRGVTEEIFQTPEKLHLTVEVFILTDDKERKLVEEKFNEVGDKIIRPLLSDHKPLFLEVKGLDCMNDDPSEINVMYANVDIINHKGLLQRVCDNIYDAFKVLDFAKENNKTNVKIHITVMNTSFLLKENIDENNEYSTKIYRNTKKTTFDGTNILKRFKDFYFGKQELNSFNLCIRFTEDENGFYKNAAVFKL